MGSKNRVNWLIFSQSINKKENPEIRSRIQEYIILFEKDLHCAFSFDILVIVDSVYE